MGIFILTNKLTILYNLGLIINELLNEQEVILKFREDLIAEGKVLLCLLYILGIDFVKLSKEEIKNENYSFTSYSFKLKLNKIQMKKINSNRKIMGTKIIEILSWFNLDKGQKYKHLKLMNAYDFLNYVNKNYPNLYPEYLKQKNYHERN